jgi:putative SOS response-associated peptidase YedK
MPLTLTADEATRWLDPDQDAGKLIKELKGHTLPLDLSPVSTAVNNARNKADLVFLEK